MKVALINDRQTIKVVQVGLIRLLLALILATASLPAFSASNIAPVISGKPATSVVVGSSYYFQPTATGANGDKLRFSISNKPAWAGFNKKTGLLNGAPGLASVGTYSDIVISVFDRKTSASLPPFSIQVQAASSASGGTTGGSATVSDTTVPVTNPDQIGSLTLQWTAPVTRSDGTPLPLSDIDGYYIYYGTSAGNYLNRIDVADGTVQAATLTDLPVGPYYLVMTTYDVNGLESAYSSMVAKNAQ